MHFWFLEDISSSPLTCICFLTETEILCCNSLSQMKLFDLRVDKSDITADINNFSQVIVLFTIFYMTNILILYINY